MKNIIIILGALVASLNAQVTVSIAQPNAGQSIGQNFQAAGPVASSAASIVNVSLSIDGGSYVSVPTLAGIPPSYWFGAINAPSLSVGSHTVRARATDASANVGFSSIITFTVVHSNPVCAHSAVSGSSTVFCESTQSHIISGSGNSVSVTNSGGYTAGQLLFCQVEASVPASPRTVLASSVSPGDTVIHVVSSAGFPATPFSATLSPVNGIGTLTPQIPNPEDVVTVSNVTGTTWTVSAVPNAHASGEVAGYWGAYAWQASQLTNTLSYTWTFWGNLGTRATDNDIEQEAVFYTIVPTTTASADTITAHNVNGDGNVAVIQCNIYSTSVGSFTPGNSAALMGWGGPNDGSTGTPGNAYINPLTVTTGDLIINSVFSAPTNSVAPDTLRVQDASRPFAMISDSLAASTTVTPQFTMNVDGFSMITLAFHVSGGAAASGKSVVLSSQTVSNGSIPGIASNGVCTFEWSLSNWGSPSAGDHPVQPNPCDLNVYWVFGGASPSLAINSLHETGASSNCIIAFTGHNLVSIRWQRVPTSSTTGSDICQAWDELGTLFTSQSYPYTGITGPVTTNGVTLGGTTGSVSTAYIRIYSTNFSTTATPPTTAQSQTAAIWQWKFDLGNNTPSLTDSTGNGFTGVLSSGAITDPGQTIDTPYQTLVVALPRTCNAPSYNTWISFRMNQTNCLEGTTSYSQANASPVVTATWTNVSGPATPTIVSASALTTNITGISAFGTYTFNMLATDAASNTANVQIAVGAVNYDANGVVIQSDPNATVVFGPQMTFGQGPWGYKDERNCTAIRLQIDGKDCFGNQVQASGNPYPAQAAQWVTTAAGTISYPFAGVGPAPGQDCYGSGTTGGNHANLNGGITATATSIAIHHAECLDGLLTLPTWILIGSSLGSQELVRITAASATSGDATLTVGFDGRGLAGAIYLNSQPVVPAQIWSTGTFVGEMRVKGTATSFITDAARPMCPAGAPGPPGAVTYSAGTVSGTGSSTTLTGHSTSWTQNSGTSSTNVVFLTDTSHNTITQQYIRVTGTHASGTNFVFWAFVTAVAADNSSITISRALPADFDAGNFSYKLTAASYWSLEFVKDANTYRALEQPVGCESETAAFIVSTHDIPTLDLTTQSSVKISYKTVLGAQSPFGPNFYGTGLAARAFYYRSGWTPALMLANSIDDFWVRDPEICGGYCGGLALNQGGGAIGGIADKILNGSSLLSWLDVTQFAVAGAADAARNCNYDDPRDQGYQQSWLALIALGDPDATRQLAWDAGLLAWVTRDTTCRRNASDGYTGVQVNSWAGSSVFATNGPALTLTAGSTAVTGSGFTSAMCAGENDGSGTIHVVAGSTTAGLLTGSLPAFVAGSSGYRITITDTTTSPIFVGTYQYQISGSVVTLAGNWNGATGDFHFMSENATKDGWLTAIGSSNADFPDVSAATGYTNNAMLQKFWACKYNNSGSLTLNRPWDGANGTYYMFSYVVAGFEVQPFMDGVKTVAMNWASQYTDPVVSAAYIVNLPLIGTWMATYGVDTNTVGTLGAYYDRVQGGCEPGGVPNALTLFDTIKGFTAEAVCGYMGLATATGGEYTSRVNTAEAGAALVQYFNYQCTLGTTQCNTARTFVDSYYGAIFGNCSLTVSVYCDTHYVNTSGELSNASLGSYKWTGFFFGVGELGLDGQYPVLRVSGSTPPSALRPSLRGNIRFRGGVRP